MADTENRYTSLTEAELLGLRQIARAPLVLTFGDELNTTGRRFEAVLAEHAALRKVAASAELVARTLWMEGSRLPAFEEAISHLRELVGMPPINFDEV